jgi:hypothetical protein
MLVLQSAGVRSNIGHTSRVVCGHRMASNPWPASPQAAGQWPAHLHAADDGAILQQELRGWLHVALGTWACWGELDGVDDPQPAGSSAGGQFRAEVS